MKYADLHVHTVYSDSTLSPEEVVAVASKKGLAAIAICDHDCVDGIEPSVKAALASGIEIIPGIELDVEKHDAEIHILGYFIDYASEQLRVKLKEIQDYRVNRIYKISEKLKNIGVDLEPDGVFKLSGKGSVGRAHVAQILIKTGKVRDFREAFEKYIGFSRSCYVSNIKLSTREAMELIIKNGGVPVMAHPGILGKDEYIYELMESGLKGIEVYHTDHNAKTTRHYENIARQYNLIATGGSDCHGLGKGRILIGSVRVGYDVVDALRKESGKNKSG